MTAEPDGDATTITFDDTYLPRGGPIGRLSGPLIDRMRRKTVGDMLDAAARAGPTAG